MDLLELWQDLNLSHQRAIKYIWENPQISRVELAQKMQLNKSSVTRIIEQLNNWGILEEKSKESLLETSPRGRPSIALNISPNLGHVYGIEFRPDSFCWVILDTAGTLHQAQQRRFRSEELLLSFEERFALVLKEVYGSSDSAKYPILGIGIGLIGIIDPYESRILYSEAYEIYDELDIHSLIREIIPESFVVIDNDARCCAFLECHRSPQIRNFLVILGELCPNANLRAGSSSINIGLGFILNGSIYRGCNYSAGEFQSIFKHQENFTQFNLQTGQEAILLKQPELLHAVFDELCLNIAFLIDTLNLEEVHFVGNIVSYAQQLSKSLETAIEQQWAHNNPVQVSIQFSELGELAVAMGAGTYALHSLFHFETL